MVHALREIWRVLVPGGILLDLRPFHVPWPLEVVVKDRVTGVGTVNDSASIPDDLAANAALDEAVHQGWFVREQGISFDYAWYWDSTSELKVYYENRSPPVHISAAVLGQAHRLLDEYGHEAQVRIRIHLTLRRYRKLALL
jgi:hypothetical protein